MQLVVVGCSKVKFIKVNFFIFLIYYVFIKALSQCYICFYKITRMLNDRLFTILHEYNLWN